jgi:hypothetical protein
LNSEIPKARKSSWYCGDFESVRKHPIDNKREIYLLVEETPVFVQNTPLFRFVTTGSVNEFRPWFPNGHLENIIKTKEQF